jgi:hypothetical protein
MSTPMGVSALLVWEGVLVLGVLAVRTVCLRLVNPDDLPGPVRGRVRAGNRLAPAVAALSMAMVMAGLIIQVAS